MTDSSMHNFDQLEQQLGALARTITEDDWRLEAPPADLLSAIMADVRSDQAQPQTQTMAPRPQQPLRPQQSLQSAPPLQQPSPFQQHEHQQQPSQYEQPAHFEQPTHRAETQHDDVPSLNDRRQAKAKGRSGSNWLMAAAAVAVVAVGGAFLATQVGSDEPSGVTVASATIVNDELPVAFDQSGSAVLVNNDGDLVLDIDVPALPESGDAFYEVWMIDTNVEGMISLGVLSADGRIDVPDGINPGDFPVVDVSVEPLDGDPTHSGQSILRGVLDV